MSLEQTSRGTYGKIAQELRGRIDRGDYPAGSRLPSELELIAEFGVARATIRKAIAELTGSGAATTIHGVGTFVVADSVTTSPLPKHREISAELRRRIEEGELRPGDALPSEAELQEEFLVARTTVRRAFKTLEDAGLVLIVRGKHRTVAELSD